MDLQLRPLTIAPAALNGLSQRLVSSHYDNNYTGAVKRLNAIRQQLSQLNWPATPVFAINGLKREELIAANSAWLHELYMDFGAKAAAYVDAFMQDIRWEAVMKRFSVAIEADARPWAVDPEQVRSGAQIVDVRRAANYAQSTDRIVGAVWRDPIRGRRHRGLPRRRYFTGSEGVAPCNGSPVNAPRSTASPAPG